MKKTILKAMLFFAFLVIGIQSTSAQYINSDDATITLMGEMQDVIGNPIYEGQQEKNSQYSYLSSKLELYTFVYERISNGQTVENAISQGADTFNYSASSTSAGTATGKTLVVAPLHQELMDLLSQ